jgi:hypothetical protein
VSPRRGSRPGARAASARSSRGRLARRLAAASGATALLASASAQAASAPTVHGGLYGAKETLVEAGKSAAVDAIVIDRGKRAEEVGVACSSGPSPAQGLERETTLTVHVPGTLAISRSGTFSYSGTVTLTPEDTQSGVSATSSVVIKGRFTAGKIVKEKTIALKGTISASVCGAATPSSFSLIWASSSTAT